MPRYIKLSYSIDEKTPLYPGTCPVSIKAAKDQRKGDSCNTYTISFSNHSGTHIDGPKHFFRAARGIAAYPADAFFFNDPRILNCAGASGRAIEGRQLERSLRSADFDMLILRTGFSKYRATDPSRYIKRNPYLSPDAAELLRKRCPNLRAIGIDCISIASHANREAGRKTHSILLDGPDPIFIIEDMFIPERLKRLDRVMAVPSPFRDIDSAPCNVIGVLDD